MNIVILLICAAILGTDIFVQSGKKKSFVENADKDVELVTDSSDLTFKHSVTNNGALYVGRLFVVVLVAILIADIILL